MVDPVFASGDLQAGTTEILRLARNERIRLGAIPKTLESIVRVSRRALGVARASVWMVEDGVLGRVVLVSEDEAPDDELAPDGLPLDDHPKLVERLTSRFEIAVPDIAVDPVCVGLVPYFERHGVGALLDVPIVVGGQLLGVVCHEHVGRPRAWTEEERVFGNLVGTVVLTQLESERRVLAELRAQWNEARYEHLVESLPVSVYSFDTRTGTLQYISSNIRDLGGMSREEWLAVGGVQTWVQCIHPDDRPAVLQRFRGTMDEDFEPDLTYRLRLPNRRERVIRDRCQLVRDRNGKPIAIHGMLADVTEEHEVKLRNAELARRFHAVLDSPHLNAVMLDVDGAITFANAAFERIIGREEPLVGLSWFDTMSSPQEASARRAAYVERVATGEVPVREEEEVRTASGATRRFVWSNVLLRDPRDGLEGVARLGIDLTDRDREDAERHHAQRLQSLGMLAAGVAHDVRNTLHVLSITTEEIAELGLDQTSQILEDQRAALEQAESLTSTLLAFSTSNTTDATVVTIDALLQGAAPLLRRAAGDTPLDVDLGSDEKSVRIDTTRLQQVVLNLVTNAAHAMQNRKGRIRLVTRAERAPRVNPTEGRHPDGPCVRLTVEDAGIGMTSDAVGRIFEPFYTSKPGRGTGLGLSIVSGVVQGAGGSIRVTSEVGVGTSIDVWLPVAHAHALR